jgi:thiol:disulfide interchange protein
MTTSLGRAFCFSILLFAASLAPALAAGPEMPKEITSALYDEKADGGKQIAEALAAAHPGNKRVLLTFGANWCGWCRRLHALFHDDPAIAAELQAHYVVVLVDVNGEHNKAIDARYGSPSDLGLPALVVLNAKGQALKSQDSTEFEEGSRHSPAKVLAFLKTWAAG